MNPKVIQVIIAYENRGQGTESDPIRNVTRIYSLDGEFIAEYDPCVIKE